MDFKTFSGEWSVKNAPERKVSGVFATDGVDHDNDLTDAHSIRPGQEALVSSWAHKAVDGEAPVGMAKIWRGKDHYGFDAQYFDTPDGNAAFETVRQGGHLVQWSYALKAQREPATYQGKSCTLLRSVELIELSPVTRAAGISTRTLSAKGHCACGCHDSALPPDLAHEMSMIRGEMLRKEWVERQRLKDIHVRLIADTVRDQEEMRQIEAARRTLEQFGQVWL